MNNNSNILSTLLRILTGFDYLSEKEKAKIEDSELINKVIYKNELGGPEILQIDTIKALKPFIQSIAEDLNAKPEMKSSASEINFEELQTFFAAHQIPLSVDDETLLKSILSLEKNLSPDQLDLDQIAKELAYYASLFKASKKQLSNEQINSAIKLVNQQFGNKLTGNNLKNLNTSGPLNSEAMGELLEELSLKLSAPDAKAKFEEIVRILDQKMAILFGEDRKQLEQKRKNKYDQSAKDAIADALKNKGFDIL